MARDPKVKVVLDADPKGATRGIETVRKGFRSLGASIKTLTLGQIAAFTGAVLALRKFGRAVADVVKAATDQEDAIRALTSALETLGEGTDRVVKSLSAQAVELQRTTTFGDEAIIKAQSRIASFTNEEAAIKALTIASADLAAAQGIDLVSAANLLARKFAGTESAIARYGIVLEGAAKSSERLESVVNGVTNLFGGRAAAAAETFSGKVAQLKNVFGDMQEAVGDSLIKNRELIDGIDQLKDNIGEATPAVAELANGIVSLGLGYVNALAAMGAFVVDLRLFLEGTTSATEGTQTSMRALEDTADRLGITVKQLQVDLASGALRNAALNDAARDAATSMGLQADQTKRAASELKEFEKQSAGAATAMEKLATSLGEVSEAQLQNELAEIQSNLEAVRVTTGGATAEFARLEEIATSKMTALRDRIASLRSGMGDLGEAAEETSTEMDTLGESITDVAASTIDLNSGLSIATSGLQRSASQARITSREFDLLADSIGRAAAVSQALGGGATLSQGGTRIRLPGGGSRLVRDTSGTTGTGSYTGAPTGRFTVGPDGILRPA